MEFFLIAHEMHIKAKQSLNSDDIESYINLEQQYAELGFNTLIMEVNHFNSNRHRDTVPICYLKHFDSIPDAFCLFFKLLSQAKHPKITNNCLNYYSLLFTYLASGEDMGFKLNNIDIDVLKLYWLYHAIEAVKSKNYVSTESILDQLNKAMEFEVTHPSFRQCIAILTQFERSRLEAAIALPFSGDSTNNLEKRLL